jgi:hypothetical protein
VLAACAVILAIVGLAPALSWLPEWLVLGTAAVVPIAVLSWTGFRAASQAGRFLDGPMAAAFAGAIGGCAGGLAYLLFGKPALNILIGLIAGAIGGAVVGFAGALSSRFPALRQRPG